MRVAREVQLAHRSNGLVAALNASSYDAMKGPNLSASMFSVGKGRARQNRYRKSLKLW